MTAAFDVLIVGGGAAGLRAAIAVAQTDPALRASAKRADDVPVG